ncbi:MAG: hypothetical protein WCH34_13615 [Bacteroidota bacterium]
MKTIFLFLVGIFLLAETMYAQSPHAINYQGLTRDNSGNVLSNQMASIRLSLLKYSAYGKAVYNETHGQSKDILGLFLQKIDQRTIISGNFIQISQKNHSFYVKIEIDANTGSNLQWLSTHQFESSPYTLFSAENGLESIPGRNHALCKSVKSIPILCSQT